MLIDDVSSLLREASAKAILPKFQSLASDEVSEKSPGEVVTSADRESELLITAGLHKIRPGSRVVGEEACNLNPGLVKGLDQGTVWLVDPLDGTANFAAGRRPFSIMVALLNDGEPVLSWMLDPIADEMCVAERGSGARIEGSSIKTMEPVQGDLKGAILHRFMPDQVRHSVLKSASRMNILPGMFCAGAEYPAVVKGSQDFAVFWRTLPWDHIPGLLFLQEAGGVACRPDGTPFVVGVEQPGLMVARTSETMARLRSIIEF